MNPSIFKVVCSLFSIVPVLLAVNFTVFGQCGVYLRRSYTNIFPYRAYIDKSNDLTGDGVPDLIGFGIDNTANQSNKLYVIPNNGDGTFGSPTIINAPPNLYFYPNILVGSFNNDSFKDIVAYFETAPASALVYINNGNGTFTPRTLVNASEMGTPLQLLDINNDGIGDYLGWQNFTQIRYSLGNADGTFSAPVGLSSSGSVGELFYGDFNNDGLIDLNTRLTILINQGSGIFTSSSMPPFVSNEYVKQVADFNGDGRSDILTQTFSGNYKISLLTRTDTGFDRTDYSISGQQNYGGTVYVGNFGGDTAPDVVYAADFLNKTIVFTNDGSGVFTRRDFDYRFGNSTNASRIPGDFDNDGKTDLVTPARGKFHGAGIQPGKIFPEASITLQKNVCARPGQARIVDFDGSDSTDYSYWNPSNGEWSYKTNLDSLSVTETVNWGLGSLGDIPAPGDFDGDGITDRAVYRNGTGVWYIRRSSDLQWFVFQFGLPGDKPVAADFDGDTISDIAVWRPSDGNWYIWHMGTQQFFAAHFGLTGDVPVPADFDGDLKTDLAVFRPSTGVWYYLKSSDGNFAAVLWGIDTDKPVPADYDGDGRADISVYRESENNLYILRSYNYSFAAVQYGIFQDVPQIGDFNGDFIADFGIYRPFAERWYSTDSAYYTSFGDAGVMPTSSILKIE